MRKSNLKRTRRRYLIRVLQITALLVIVLDILFVVIPDKKSSEQENRNLEQLPSLTWHTLTSGSFEEKFETYLADQFPFRNQWIVLQTTISRALGKTESNGIFLAHNGYLIQNFTEATEKNYRNMLSAIQQIAAVDSDITTRAMIVPTAVSIYQSKLPYGAVTGDENAFLDEISEDLTVSGIQFIDVRDTFNEATDTQLYYRTDHHWTTDAAYLAYQQYLEAADIQASTSFTSALISDSFCGTLSASSGFRTKMTDSIYVYQPETPTEYVVTYTDEGTRYPSVYFTQNLEIRDQYTVFFNGNYPQIDIKTNAKSDKTLLIFKDSYANCFVPFLIPEYSHIIMVDARYYTDDIKTLIESEDITDILFLYNADTLASDTNLSQLIEN